MQEIQETGSIPRLGRYPGEGNGNPPQYSCLVNSMDRGSSWAYVHGVTKSRTWLNDTIMLWLSTHNNVRDHWVSLLPKGNLIKFMYLEKYLPKKNWTVFKFSVWRTGEQCRGGETCCRAADWWGLGCLSLLSLPAPPPKKAQIFPTVPWTLQSQDQITRWLRTLTSVQWF